MSGVSITSEFTALDGEAFGIGLGEMEWMTINALRVAFAPFDERLRLINEVVKPGYARLRARVVGSHRLKGDDMIDWGRSATVLLGIVVGFCVVVLVFLVGIALTSLRPASSSGAGCRAARRATCSNVRSATP